MAEEVMEMMQANGVPAGIVNDCHDVYENPQLRYQRHFRELEHKEIGKHYYQCPPFILSKTPSELTMPSPCLGEHNHYFHTEILGITDDQFVELLGEGVLE